MAFSESTAAGTTNGQINLVPDAIITPTAGNDALIPEPSEILWGFGIGTNMTRLRIDTPTLRDVSLPSLVPVNTGLTVPSPYNLIDMRNTFIPLPNNVQIQMQASQSDAGAQIMNALLAVAFRRVSIPAGKVTPIRATTTVVTAVGAWTLSSLVLDQTLPPGRYALVGAHVNGTGALACRFVIPGTRYRPGVVCSNTQQGIPHPIFRDKSMGVWGYFNNVNIPQIETIAATIGDVDDVYMDVIGPF